MIRRLEELAKDAEERGLSPAEVQIMRAEFHYGMQTFKQYTPFRGLMTREFIESSEDTGAVFAQRYIASIERKREEK